MTTNNGYAIEQITADFKYLGYSVAYKLLSTVDFGVPQKRERVIIIGTKKDVLPIFDFELLRSRNKSWITLETAIGGLESDKEGGIENHFWSKAKKIKAKEITR